MHNNFMYPITSIQKVSSYISAGKLLTGGSKYVILTDVCKYTFTSSYMNCMEVADFHAIRVSGSR